MSRTISPDEEWPCPMPVLRENYDDIADRWYSPTLGRCGAPIYISRYESTHLMGDGECDACGPTWKVECLGGHVLLLPDHEGSDDFARVPFSLSDTSYVLHVLASLDISGMAPSTDLPEDA